MGYTHYWEAESEITTEQWEKIAQDSRKLIEASPAPIWFEDDQPEAAPHIGDGLIRFNGAGADGHETFWLDRENAEFAFCKTAAKPYDLVVCAILAVVKEHAPQVRVSSDGDARDWAAPLRWASDILKRPILLPFRDETA